MSKLRAIRQAGVGAAQTMIRTDRSALTSNKWLAADSAYGSASNLDWLVNEQGIAPHVPVIDKSQREDGTFSRKINYDEIRDIAACQRERRSRLAISTPITRCGISLRV